MARRGAAGQLAGGLEDLEGLSGSEWPYATILLALYGKSTPHLQVLAKETRWEGTLARLLRGETTASKVLREAAAEPDETKRAIQECEAHFYLGVLAQTAGDRKTAEGHLRQAAKGPVNVYERHMAARELGRLR
jgi:lipoprotein NlpI